MKKLLIIQTDSAYFLFETLRVIESNAEALKGFNYQVLVNQEAYREVKTATSLSSQLFLLEHEQVNFDQYDLSINLSLNEGSWKIQEKIKALHKVGSSQSATGIKVPDLWSSYHLTIKANVPFLTFHLQDVYKHILGIKRANSSSEKILHPKTIVCDFAANRLFKPGEQEELMNGLSRRFRNMQVKSISEIDPVTEENVLYVGLPSLASLKFPKARYLLLGSSFQGFNLIPAAPGSYLLTCGEGGFKAQLLLDLVDKMLSDQELTSSTYQIYQIQKGDHEELYLQALTQGDEHYPFYQAYTVLWNFILGLVDVDLFLKPLNDVQKNLIDTQLAVLTKVTRLHEYAMVSLDVILKECKSQEADAGIIEGHLKNLREMDKTFDGISQSHHLLRPLLDYYRIRRGQNEGSTLLDQVQNSILTYHEEHQAMKAFIELLTQLKAKN